ncbi:MAG TPA: hypothetical protein ENJ08_08690 [Gammaproteobacteria bacterium]|nr:hypothetical protein [Gammaproteobacteria bacterium]
MQNENIDEAFNQSVKHMNQGENEIAPGILKSINEADCTTQEKGTVYFNMAACQCRIGDDESAANSLKKAIEFQPELSSAVYEDGDLAEIYDDTKFSVLFNEPHNTDTNTDTDTGAEAEEKMDNTLVVWEVKSVDGSVREYSDEDVIVQELISNNIKLDSECRHIDKKEKERDKNDTKWEKVSNSLLKSNLKFQILFEPVWVHTLKGAGYGILSGILLWLFSGILYYSIYEHKPGSMIVFSILFYMFLSSRLPAFIRRIIGSSLTMLAIVLYMQGYDFSFKDISEGLVALVGALAGGAIAGVFPGMIIGTLTGFIRQDNLIKPPSSIPENFMKIAVKGILIPLILFSGMISLYITYEPVLIEFIQNQ